MANTIGLRLRWTRADRERVVWLIQHHMVFLQVAEMRRSTLRRYLGHPWFEDLHALHRADRLGGNGDLATWNLVEQARLEFQEETPVPPPLIGGGDLLALGLQAGPVFSDILREVETAQLEDEIGDREEALALAMQLAREKGLLPSGDQD